MATCPHCGAAAEEGAAFCGSCGKAVPTGSSGPRIVDARNLASTGLGRAVQGADLMKQAKKAFGCLLAVAILQTLGTLLVGGLAFSGVIDDPAVAQALKGAAVMMAVVTAGFYALAFWARRSPLPAAIAGLVLFVSLWAVDVIAAPEMAAKGIIIKVIIVGVLISAIQAGLAHRRLQQAEPAA